MPARSQQVWLITGASRGLGFDMAKHALAAGHKVLACYRKKPETSSSNNTTSKFDELESLGGTWVHLDPSSEDAESKARALVAEHGGKIDVLVNNAGYGMLASTEDVGYDQVRDIFNTNFLGPLRTIKGVLPSMRERKSGTIVNVSSAATFAPVAGMGTYTATKAALEAQTESLQAELQPFNIRVMLVEPGAVATEFGDRNGSAVLVSPAEPYLCDGPFKQVLDWISQGGLDAVRTESPPVALRIVEAIDRTGFMDDKDIDLRLVLGKDAGSMLEGRAAIFNKLTGLKDVWSSV